MSVFEAAFGIPAGHTLRDVRSTTHVRGACRRVWEWEREEHDERGMLVAGTKAGRAVLCRPARTAEETSRAR
jgi:hypothetical protein